MQAWNIAIIGCGNIARMHFEAYLPHRERVRIVAVCDTSPERVDWAKEQCEGAEGFTSLDAAIARGGWDVAVVCTPTLVREPVVTLLTAAGKHVLVEKPLADTYDEARRMVDAAERAGVTLAVNQNFRYHYPFDAARTRIAEGKIGRVRGIAQQDLMLRQDSGWRVTAPRHALSVMGVHWLDGFRWLLRDEGRSVQCATDASPAIKAAGESDAFVQVAFTGGAVASLVESFSCPIRKTETVVIGEAGTLVLTYDSLALFDLAHRASPVERWENPLRGANKPKATFVDLNLLLTALEQGTPPPNSGRDNLGTVALLDAAYRSAREGRPVALEPATAGGVR